MPCDKVNCDLKQACFEVYGKFSYPPCASEQGGSPATDSQQLKAEIAYMANQLEVCYHNNLFMLLPEYVNKLRQLSAV